MKSKKLTKEQILISIDRLTRFKQTEEKYLRVFKDIILTAQIEPKYKKLDLDNFDYGELKNLACKIFNSSLDGGVEDLSINNYLINYENEIFKNSVEVQDLLNNNLNYAGAVKLIDKNTNVSNLRWLKLLSDGEAPKVIREKYSTIHPIEKVIIAEGITEEILLPVFAHFCSFDFSKNGVKIISAGGKNQVVKLYYKLSQESNIPIFVLLDKDAVENRELINKKIRKNDVVYILNSGEFEDVLPKSLILKTINNEFKNFVSLSMNDISDDRPTVEILEEIYKDRCLHEFKKSDFAHKLSTQISGQEDISDEIRQIILKIKSM